MDSRHFDSLSALPSPPHSPAFERSGYAPASTLNFPEPNERETLFIIRFKTKDDVMMEPDGIGPNKYKTNNLQPQIGQLSYLIFDATVKDNGQICT